MYNRLSGSVRNKIGEFVSKVVLRKSYNFPEIVSQVSKDLASIFDLRDICGLIGRTVKKTFKAEGIYILSVNPEGDYEIKYENSEGVKKPSIKIENEGSSGKIGRDNCAGLVKTFNLSKDIILRNELTGSVAAELDAFNAELAVPVIVDRKTALMLIIGARSSGKRFNREDINLLKTLSNLTTIAIKSTRLYMEKVHADKLASIGMMSATFAHEIRNPLTSLKTFAQLIPEQYDDIEFRDKFSRIVLGEIERIDGLIGDLLDFSESDESKKLADINIISLIDEMVEYTSNKLSIEKKDISIEKNYGGDQINLHGKVEKLKHALLNIINNGCEAMGDSGVLKIKVARNDGNVNIMIEDTGGGIDPGDIENIYDPFMTTKEMGIGLGLAISKKIIEDHGGTMMAKSTLSVGTTFTVSLPLESPDAII